MPYTVVKGDTLGAIAKKYNTTVSELVTLNPIIKDPDLIRIGWELTLPGEGDDAGSAQTSDSDVGQSLNNVPGTPQVWKVGSKSYLVYTVPGTEDDPVYMAWEVASEEDLQSFFGPDQPIVYNKRMTETQFNRTGTSVFGTTDEIPAGEKDPFATWEETMEREAVIQPWILDADYQLLSAQAAVEGRSLTQAEIASTSWWKNNNKRQREWMSLYHGDPSEAEAYLEESRARVRQMLTDSGAGENPSDAVIDYMSTQWAMGNWTDSYLNNQVKAVTDPYSTYEVDKGLAPIVKKNPIGQTNAEEDRVRELLHTWLGPSFGDWSEEEIKRVAGKIRNDPQYEATFIEDLKDQRLAVLPQYTDRDLSYQAVANTWKQYWVGQWGEQPDEKSALWNEVLRLNDQAEAGKLLRREGLAQENKKMTDTFSSQNVRQFGGSVRQGVYV